MWIYEILITLLALSNIALFAIVAPIDGEMAYKTPSGKLVERIVSLEVPPRGQGVRRSK